MAPPKQSQCEVELAERHRSYNILRRRKAGKVRPACGAHHGAILTGKEISAEPVVQQVVVSIKKERHRISRRCRPEFAKSQIEHTTGMRGSQL